MTAPTRPLSAPERALWLLDQACCLNGVQVAAGRGPLTPALVRLGLDRAQARHPLWRAHVEGGDARPRFVAGSPRPIPLRLVPRRGPRSWLGPVEEELNQRFAVDDDPLFRAVLVGPDGAEGTGGAAQEWELVISHHHCMADALSIIHRFAEILDDAAAELAGRPPPLPLGSRPLQPALSDLLPPRGLRRLGDMNSFLGRQIAARARGLRKLPLDAQAPPQERRTHLLPGELAPAETEALRRRCRQEGTTVNGLLCAALLGAAALDLEGPGALDGPDGPGALAHLGCFSTVSLRGELRAPVGDDSGLFVSQATTFHGVGGGRDLWDLARELRGRLTEALARGEPLMTFPWLGLFIPGGDDPGPRFLRRVDLAAPAAVGVTNVGPLPIATRFGPFELTGLHIGLGAGTVVPLLLAVTTVSGRLFCNLLYIEPLIARPRAERVAARLLHLLRRAAGPAGPLPVASARELCDAGGA